MITFPSIPELIALGFILSSFAIILILAGKKKKDSNDANKK